MKLSNNTSTSRTQAKDKMQDNYKFEPNQLLNFSSGSYLERTSRPIYAIVFLLPFIIFYEFGTFFMNTSLLNNTQVRVVAFLWLQNALSYIGFGDRLTWMAPAFAVLVILLASQIVARKKWTIKLADLWIMSLECLVLAIPLVVLSFVLNTSPSATSDTAAAQLYLQKIQNAICLLDAPCIAQLQASMPADSLLANIVTSIGAGIYEEMVFRFILICLLMFFLQDILQLNRKSALLISVLISAALFSIHHHIIFLNGHFTKPIPFQWSQFFFRTTAGIYFAFLFAIRGFGITAGSHAFYDIIATLINAFFFPPTH